jgi:hypothetical protein
MNFISKIIDRMVGYLTNKKVQDRLWGKIKWEKHGLVERNEYIHPTSIIPKSATSEFPQDSCTVRITSAKNNRFTLYIYSKEKTRSWNNGTSHYTYISEALKIAVDCKNMLHPKYAFTGSLPSDYNAEDLAMTLNTVIETLYGNERIKAQQS